jgi:hypothetical protein
MWSWLVVRWVQSGFLSDRLVGRLVETGRYYPFLVVLIYQ